MSSSPHVNNKNNKDILIFGKRPTDGLNDIILTTEKQYPINFTENIKKDYLTKYFGQYSVLI